MLLCMCGEMNKYFVKLPAAKYTLKHSTLTVAAVRVLAGRGVGGCLNMVRKESLNKRVHCNMSTVHN